MSLSDAATASDALDSEVAARLGPVPESGAESQAPRRSHHGGSHKRGPKAAAAAPHAAQIVKPIAGVLGLLTLFLGLLLCGFNMDDPLVDVIMLDTQKHEGEEQTEAESIAKPAANILARQAWFAQYGQSLVNGEDAIALVYAVLMYTTRVVPAVQQRMRERPRERTRQDRGIPQPVPSANGYSASGYAGLSGAYAADAN